LDEKHPGGVLIDDGRRKEEAEGELDLFRPFGFELAFLPPSTQPSLDFL